MDKAFTPTLPMLFEQSGNPLQHEPRRTGR
jgi:hypothetical protein